jgi:hypothetical protein
MSDVFGGTTHWNSSLSNEKLWDISPGPSFAHNLKDQDVSLRAEVVSLGGMDLLDYTALDTDVSGQPANTTFNQQQEVQIPLQQAQDSRWLLKYIGYPDERLQNMFSFSQLERLKVELLGSVDLKEQARLASLPPEKLSEVASQWELISMKQHMAVKVANGMRGASLPKPTQENDMGSAPRLPFLMDILPRLMNITNETTSVEIRECLLREYGAEVHLQQCQQAKMMILYKRQQGTGKGSQEAMQGQPQDMRLQDRILNGIGSGGQGGFGDGWVEINNWKPRSADENRERTDKIASGEVDLFDGFLFGGTGGESKPEDSTHGNGNLKEGYEVSAGDTNGGVVDLFDGFFFGGTRAETEKRERREGGSTTRDCANCHTRVTPEWRRGPSGNKDLCNSCGLRWAGQVRRSTSI